MLALIKNRQIYLDEQAQNRLIKDYQETNCPKALETLTRSYLKYFLKMACARAKNADELDIYFNLAAMGFMRALKTYNPKKTRLTTYAFRWCKAYMQRHNCNMNNIIHFPKDFGNGAKISESRKEDIQKVFDFQFICGDKEIDIDHNNRSSIFSNISNNDQLIEDSVNDKLNNEKLLKLINSKLNERERFIIISRYRFDDEHITYNTLEELGSRFNVTRERIRQIEKKALKKLRTPETKELFNSL